MDVGPVGGEYDRVIREIKSMEGVRVLEDYGRHEEDAEVVPDDHPNAGGLCICCGFRQV